MNVTVENFAVGSIRPVQFDNGTTVVDVKSYFDGNAGCQANTTNYPRYILGLATINESETVHMYANSKCYAASSTGNRVHVTHRYSGSSVYMLTAKSIISTLSRDLPGTADYQFFEGLSDIIKTGPTSYEGIGASYYTTVATPSQGAWVFGNRYYTSSDSGDTWTSWSAGALQDTEGNTKISWFKVGSAYHFYGYPRVSSPYSGTCPSGAYSYRHRSSSSVTTGYRTVSDYICQGGTEESLDIGSNLYQKTRFNGTANVFEKFYIANNAMHRATSAVNDGNTFTTTNSNICEINSTTISDFFSMAQAMSIIDHGGGTYIYFTSYDSSRVARISVCRYQ